MLSNALVATLAVALLAPAPKAVRLQFAWPSGLRGHCVQRYTRTATGPATIAESAFVLRWESAGDRLRIIEEDEAPPRLSGDLAPAASEFDLGTSTLLVERDGRFVGIENLDAVASKALDLAATRAPLPAGGRDELAATLRRALTVRAKDAWAMRVRFWVGSTLEPGETLEWEVPAGGGNAPGLGTAVLEEELPCPGGPRGRRCVRIASAMTWTEGLESAERARSLIAAAAAGAPVPQLHATTHEERSLLVTEPATLVPHRFERTRVSRTELTLADGTRTTTELRKSWVLTCRYEPTVRR